MPSMKPSRRQVLASLPALAVLPSCELAPEPEPEPEPVPDHGPCGPDTSPWAAPGVVDEEAFAWSVQVSDALVDSALVSVRTTRAGPFSLRAAKWCDGGWQEIDGVEGLEPNDGGVVQTELGGLEADNFYSLALYDTDGDTRSPVARLRTPLGPDTLRRLRIGASSCLGDAHRPWDTLSRAAEEQLDAFLLLGDTIYAEGDDTVEEYRETWGVALSTSGLYDLCLSTSLVHTWDDHEVDNNWSWDEPGAEEQYAAASQVYGESLPFREGPGGSGLWRELSWGQTLDVFVLDCRAERLDGNYISVEQMEWLKAGLLASEARFKFILNSVPITDLEQIFGDSLLEDRWSGFPEQREEILTFIEAEGIGGILWIAGDLHYGQVGRVGIPGELADGQWEVLVGPAGSFRNPLPGLIVEGPNYPQFEPQFPVLQSEWTVTVFELDPFAGTVRALFLGDEGETAADDTLSL